MRESDGPEPGTIGRWVVVKWKGAYRVGTVIDNVAGTREPKRVRMQWGPFQGEVAMPGEYEVKCWLDNDRNGL